MDTTDDAGRAMALVIGAYWTGVATVEEVASTARLHADEDSSESLLRLAALDPRTTDELLPGQLASVLEDFGIFLTRHPKDVLEVFSLAYKAPQFQRDGALDRQAFVAWVADTFDHRVEDGFAQRFAEANDAYAAGFVQTWGHSDEFDFMIDAAVDDYLEWLDVEVVRCLEWLNELPRALRNPPDDHEEPSGTQGSVSGAWLPALADIVGAAIQAILRGL